MVCEKRALREPWLPKTSAPRLHGRNTERAVTLYTQCSLLPTFRTRHSCYRNGTLHELLGFGIWGISKFRFLWSRKNRANQQGMPNPCGFLTKQFKKKNSLMFHSRNPDWRKQQKVVDWGVPLSFVSTFIFKPFFLVFWTQNIVH